MAKPETHAEGETTTADLSLQYEELIVVKNDAVSSSGAVRPSSSAASRAKPIASDSSVVVLIKSVIRSRAESVTVIHASDGDGVKGVARP